MIDSHYPTPYIKFLLHCASDVNVGVVDVLVYVTKYFLTPRTLNRNRHMIASVNSQFQKCECA